jgi:ParB family chromosome partitioning protein
MLLDGKLTEGHARAILSLETEEQMQRIAQKVHAEKLSVRKTEQLVRERLTEPPKPPSENPDQGPSEPPTEFEQASQMMQEALTLPVKVRPFRKGGRVEIRFREREELEEILSLLTSSEDQPAK